MVYGTLMRHQRNHWRLYGSKFLGDAQVQGRLFQFRGPGLDFPLLRRTTEPGVWVQGEVYEVNRAVLDVQDWYELLYKRVKVLAHPPHSELYAAGAKPLSCWVYEGLDRLPYNWARKLPNGRWPIGVSNV
jgi:gamma-glutamylcyclotransferase (GGCT)/AIG2-like uncharacterized protein YtfP